MTAMDWPALVTLGVLILGFGVAWLVGRARVKYGVKAPATTGHEMFERAYRVPVERVPLKDGHFLIRPRPRRR